MFLRILFAPTANNPAKQMELSGTRHCSISKEYDLSKIKEVAKSNNCTINDICMAASSVALK
jgi:NRPS condensation-like uncharacterized protein